MKTIIRRTIVLQAALVAFGSLAMAQEGPAPGQPRQRLRERAAGGEAPRPAAAEPAPPAVDRIFNVLDDNGDGKIDKREMAQKGRGLLERLQAAGKPSATPDKPARPQVDKKPAGKAPDARRPDARRPDKQVAKGGPAMRDRGLPARRGEARADRFRGEMRDRRGQGRGGPWGAMAGRGFGRDRWQRPSDAPTFQPFGGGMSRAPQGFRAERPAMARPEGPALRMLDSNGDGRLDAPEIRSKIEVLERLLRQAEREPIDLRMPGPMGPPRR